MHGEMDLLKQSNESHAYPPRPFIAMSYFISFEPLIIPVYARCFCLYAVLLLTRHSHHDPASDSHTLSHDNLVAGGPGGGGGQGQVPGQQPGESLILRPTK